MKPKPLFNSVLPSKIYSLVSRNGVEIDQIQAKDVHEALALGRMEHGDRCRCAILMLERKEARFER